MFSLAVLPDNPDYWLMNLKTLVKDFKIRSILRKLCHLRKIRKVLKIGPKSKLHNDLEFLKTIKGFYTVFYIYKRTFENGVILQYLTTNYDYKTDAFILQDIIFNKKNGYFGKEIFEYPVTQKDKYRHDLYFSDLYPCELVKEPLISIQLFDKVVKGEDTVILMEDKSKIFSGAQCFTMKECLKFHKSISGKKIYVFNTGYMIKLVYWKLCNLSNNNEIKFKHPIKFRNEFYPFTALGLILIEKEDDFRSLYI